VSASTTPYGRNADDDGSKDVEMSLAPYSSRRNKDEACKADAK